MTLSTAGMIAAVREAANMTKTQEERDVLNGIANRVEMLAEANSINSLELNSILEALKIPVSDSVQAGTIAVFCKLQSDLQEATALANRLRRTAKECQEENQQLRTQLAELQGQEPIAWTDEQELRDLAEHKCAYLYQINPDNPYHDPRRQIMIYRGPVPPAASQPYTVPDAIDVAVNEVLSIDSVASTAVIKALFQQYTGKMRLNATAVFQSGYSSVSSAIKDVIAERERQISAEGWTPEHDDQHMHFEMAVAAACYIMADDDPRADIPELWPWSPRWWKPTTPRRDLVKAGALVIAEIERIDREEANAVMNNKFIDSRSSKLVGQ